MNPIWVEWVDSVTHPFWNDRGQEYTVLKCVTVGILVEDKPDALVVALSATLDEEAKPYSDVCVIPKVSITNWYTLVGGVSGMEPA